MKIKQVATNVYILLFSLFVMAIICSILSEENWAEIIAHITGMITALGCACVAIFLIMCAEILKWHTRFVGIFGFGCLTIGYILYLLFHISPSNYDFAAHSYISMLFDVGTSCAALFSFLLFIDLRFKNK